MKPLFILVRFIAVLLLSACSNSPIELESLGPLPEPIVRVIRPTEKIDIPSGNSNSEEILDPAIEVSISSPEAPIPRMAFGTESHLMDFQNHSDIFGENKIAAGTPQWFNLECH